MQNKLFENWRRFLKEENSGERTIELTKDKVKQLNKSIASIVISAQKVLGAEGPIPTIFHMLEKIKLEKPMSMVAEEDDLEQLRQKYYGPEGELSKRGPKSVSGLKKGMGKMDASEWEETGYVIRIPQEVLDDFNVLVEETA